MQRRAADGLDERLAKLKRPQLEALSFAGWRPLIQTGYLRSTCNWASLACRPSSALAVLTVVSAVGLRCAHGAATPLQSVANQVVQTRRRGVYPAETGHLAEGAVT